MYVARCFYCGWGLTGDKQTMQEALAHVNECPGPVEALNPRSPNSGRLSFRSHLRCGGCGLPTASCVCVRVE